jgi:1A family penicillin-binding protein
MKKKKYIIFLLPIFIILLVASYYGVYFYAKLQPKLAIDSANGFYLYDADGNIFNGKDDDWISLDKISPYLINATIAIEDKHFYSHDGFDFLRIIKAMMNNIKSGSTKEGASTITQQYAKNLFLDFDKTWTRKLTEAWLTIRLEAHYSKDEILEGYLNTINYGGIYGIEKASEYYFGKSASDLNLAEATILAGIPKSPSNYSPIQNEENAKKRQELILTAMVENNYITEEEKQEAYNTELTYVGNIETEDSKSIMYYQDAVLNELKSISSIPSSFLSTGGLKIYTTLDRNAQKILEESMEKNLSKNEKIQIATVMMNPNDGSVLAILGGRDYNKSQYNRVVSSKRQVGSTMKPFLYYTALESGFTASTTFTSEKTVFTFSGDKTYAPENYASTYANKNISLAAAIAYSDNIYAVKTHLFLGEETLVEFANRLGISSDLEAIPSLALGTNEINIMNMMRGYATFANEGSKVTPHYITKVEDMYGNVLYEFKEEPDTILNKSNVYILNELLRNCYNKNFIDYTYPTCSSIASKITKKYAIKTGTTETDNWIFGYNKDVLVGTWLGYDDNIETNNSDSLMMKNFWVDVMETYLKDKEDNWYETPSNVVGVFVDPISGEVADNDSDKKTLFYYIKGTQPNAEDNTMEDAISAMKQE